MCVCVDRCCPVVTQRVSVLGFRVFGMLRWPWSLGVHLQLAGLHEEGGWLRWGFGDTVAPCMLSCLIPACDFVVEVEGARLLEASGCRFGTHEEQNLPNVSLNFPEGCGLHLWGMFAPFRATWLVSSPYPEPYTL